MRNLLQGLGLLCRGLGALPPGDRLCCAQFFQTSHQLGAVEVPQLRRQGAQRHFAEAALVVLRSKSHQLAPARIQRGQAFERRTRFTYRLAGQVGLRHLHLPYHAQHFTLAQGHPDQLSGLQGLRAAVGQQIAHAAVGWGLNSHVDPAVGGGVHEGVRRVSRLTNFLEIVGK